MRKYHRLRKIGDVSYLLLVSTLAIAAVIIFIVDIWLSIKPL